MNDTAKPAPASDFIGGLASRDLRMLAAIRHGLQSSVVPEVTSEMAKTVCDFGVAFLDRLIARYTEWPTMLRRQIRRQTEVLRRTVELLASAGAVHDATAEEAKAILREITEHPLDSLEQLEQCQRKVDGALELIVPALLRNDTMRTPDSLPLVNELLREQVASIRDSERELNEAMTSRVARHEALVGSRVAVSQAALQEYLRARFPERRSLEIVSFLELPGGVLQVHHSHRRAWLRA